MIPQKRTLALLLLLLTTLLFTACDMAALQDLNALAEAIFQHAAAWPTLTLTAGDQTCTLMPGGDGYTLGPDCADFALHVSANDTLWLSLALPDEADLWLALSPAPEDSSPAIIDARGRFFGCVFAAQGEQLCRVMVEWGGATYVVAIAVQVDPPVAAPAAPEPAENGGNDGTTTTQVVDVHGCVHLGDNVFQWNSVEVTYQDGVAVSETVVGGPFTGEWRPGCPQGEAPPAGDTAPSTGDTGDGNTDGDEDGGSSDDPPPPPTDPPPPPTDSPPPGSGD